MNILSYENLAITTYLFIIIGAVIVLFGGIILYNQKKSKRTKQR